MAPNSAPGHPPPHASPHLALLASLGDASLGEDLYSSSGFQGSSSSIDHLNQPIARCEEWVEKEFGNISSSQDCHASNFGPPGDDDPVSPPCNSTPSTASTVSCSDTPHTSPAAPAALAPAQGNSPCSTGAVSYKQKLQHGSVSGAAAAAAAAPPPPPRPRPEDPRSKAQSKSSRQHAARDTVWRAATAEQRDQRQHLEHPGALMSTAPCCSSCVSSSGSPFASMVDYPASSNTQALRGAFTAPPRETGLATDTARGARPQVHLHSTNKADSDAQLQHVLRHSRSFPSQSAVGQGGGSLTGGDAPSLLSPTPSAVSARHTADLVSGHQGRRGGGQEYSSRSGHGKGRHGYCPPPPSIPHAWLGRNVSSSMHDSSLHARSSQHQQPQHHHHSQQFQPYLPPPMTNALPMPPMGPLSPKGPMNAFVASPDVIAAITEAQGPQLSARAVPDMARFLHTVQQAAPALDLGSLLGYDAAYLINDCGRAGALEPPARPRHRRCPSAPSSVLTGSDSLTPSTPRPLSRDATLADVWAGFQKVSTFGLGVPTLGHAGGPSMAYFTPFLSAMQILAVDDDDAVTGAREHASCVSDGIDDDDDDEFSQNSKFDAASHDVPHTPNGSCSVDEDVRLLVHSVPPSSNRSSDSPPNSHTSRARRCMVDHDAEGTANPAPSLRDLPAVRPNGAVCAQLNAPDVQVRQVACYSAEGRVWDRAPLFDHIEELASSKDSCTAGLPKPSALKDLPLRRVHGSSWIAIMWHPLYRIPDAPLHARFITYLSFNQLAAALGKGSAETPDLSRRTALALVGCVADLGEGETGWCDAVHCDAEGRLLRWPNSGSTFPVRGMADMLSTTSPCGRTTDGLPIPLPFVHNDFHFVKSMQPQ